MATHDYNIANGSGLDVRADLNAVLSAILSQNSSPTTPTTTEAGMFWYDTTSGILKQRDSLNTSWKDKWSHDSGMLATIETPTFTGYPKAPTAPAGTSTTQIATTEFVALNGVPPNFVGMFWGLISNIPAGWYLCNGLNGTPDLRERFVYGATTDADVGLTGGSADSVVVEHTHTNPEHTHTGTTNTTGSHSHTPQVLENTGSQYQLYGSSKHATFVSMDSSGSHSHIITINSSGAGTTSSTGESATNKNLPPYMKLAYIMKG